MAKEPEGTKGAAEWVRHPDKTAYQGTMIVHIYQCKGSQDINYILLRRVGDQTSMEILFDKTGINTDNQLRAVVAAEAGIRDVSRFEAETVLSIGSESAGVHYVPSAEKMLNVVDTLAPMPDQMKIDIAESIGLNKDNLNIGLYAKGHTAAEVRYATRMISQVNRLRGERLEDQPPLPDLPDEVQALIASFAVTKGDLSNAEIIRATNAGFGKPATSSEAKAETKEGFAKKVLDSYQKREEDKGAPGPSK